MKFIHVLLFSLLLLLLLLCRSVSQSPLWRFGSHKDCWRRLLLRLTDICNNNPVSSQLREPVKILIEKLQFLPTKLPIRMLEMNKVTFLFQFFLFLIFFVTFITAFSFESTGAFTLISTHAVFTCGTILTQTAYQALIYIWWSNHKLLLT